MKLGKRAPSNRPAVPFRQFLTSIPAHPLFDQAPAFSYPVDGNDTFSDCVVAAFDHTRQVITGLLTGTQLNLSPDEIVALYKTQNPDFDPSGDPSVNGPGSPADGGMEIQTFLEYLVSTGRILAFGRIDYTNEEELKAATYIGLSVMTGVQLQEAQMSQFAMGTWDYQPGSPTIGGHCVPLAGYTNNPDTDTCITWGRPIACTQAFITGTMEEAWFLLFPEHVQHPNFRDNFDLPGFAAAVSSLTDGKVVVPVPPAPVPQGFTKNLYFGMHDPDVMRLQLRLSHETAGDGRPCFRFTVNGQSYFSNYFGDHTVAAVVRYQDKHGIVPDEGFCGPITRASLNA